MHPVKNVSHEFSTLTYSKHRLQNFQKKQTHVYPVKFLLSLIRLPLKHILALWSNVYEYMIPSQLFWVVAFVQIYILSY